MADAEYKDRCGMCGWEGMFRRADATRPAGAAFACGSCGANLRYRDEATVFVDRFGRGEIGSLVELVEAPWFASSALLYVGVSGPFRKSLTSLERYCESTIEEPQSKGARAVRRSYQDLQSLGFAADSFDVMFSSHVMEHVPDPDLAFAEAHRTLRKDGVFVFSIPMMEREHTRVRCRLEAGEVVHLVEPQFHSSPQGRALVFTDFGTDIVDRLTHHGFDASIERPSTPPALYFNAVVVATRR